MIWSIMLHKRCRGCEYWNRTSACCDYAESTGRTRLSLHKSEYLALKTDKEREAFLQDMNDHCREWKKKKYRYRTVWGDGMMVKRRVKS
jgi:hypothetical protein